MRLRSGVQTVVKLGVAALALTGESLVALLHSDFRRSDLSGWTRPPDDRFKMPHGPERSFGEGASDDASPHEHAAGPSADNMGFLNDAEADAWIIRLVTQKSKEPHRKSIARRFGEGDELPMTTGLAHASEFAPNQPQVAHTFRG